MNTSPNKNRIGIICAIELDAMFKHYTTYEEIQTNIDYKLFHVEKDNFDLFILQSGMGIAAAASGVQYLCTKCDISVLINFGVVGGLTAEMGKQKLCLVKNVVHYKYDCSEFMDLVPGQVAGHDSIYLKNDENLIKKVLKINPDLKLVTCCSGDKFVGTAEEKELLHNKFNGDICDMESAGIILTCEANHIPCVMFKAVSDGLNDGAEGFYEQLEGVSLICLQIVDEILDELTLA